MNSVEKTVTKISSLAFEKYQFLIAWSLAIAAKALTLGFVYYLFDFAYQHIQTEATRSELTILAEIETPLLVGIISFFWYAQRKFKKQIDSKNLIIESCEKEISNLKNSSNDPFEHCIPLPNGDYYDPKIQKIRCEKCRAGFMNPRRDTGLRGTSTTSKFECSRCGVDRYCKDHAGRYLDTFVLLETYKAQYKP